jgi:hypothetical protein
MTDEDDPVGSTLAAHANARTPRVVYVKYNDHVFFKNIQSVMLSPVVRETLGWVKKENDEVMLIENDRSILEGYAGFNGVIVLKSCILSTFEVPLQVISSRALNCKQPIQDTEYAFRRQSGRKTHSSKGEKTQ